jgi:hypothetical protein
MYTQIETTTTLQDLALEALFHATNGIGDDDLVFVPDWNNSEHFIWKSEKYGMSHEVTLLDHQKRTYTFLVKSPVCKNGRSEKMVTVKA